MDEKRLRILDTGVLEGRLNIAIGQAIIEAHRAGRVPDTLRFLRFPPTALVGRHQALGQEIDLDYCRVNGIGVARRITGGGAIYLDPGQLGWELAISRATLGRISLADVTRTICEAAAEGLGRLGVDARFRPRNDIEVGGRKISGTGGFFDGDTLFFQGTVLVDLDPLTMVSALRVPRAKLEKHDLDSAGQRVVTLRELLGERTPPLAAIQAELTSAMGERLGLTASAGRLTEQELGNAESLHAEEIGTDDFVASVDEPEAARGVLRGERICPGGSIRCFLRVEGPVQSRVREVLFTGDFFITPPRVIYDLESCLRGVGVDGIESAVTDFFSRTETDVLSVTADDFASALRDALDQA